MKQLTVYLHGEAVGILTQEPTGRITFAYALEWLDGKSARSLSHSLPLRKKAFEERECIGFFGGLLPEEENRKIVARNLGITSRNDFALLREIGGECAGSVSMLPVGSAPAPISNTYEKISEAELIAILDQLPKRPLLAGRAEIRLSLAGAQNKVALRREGDAYSIPLHESPSTHILKPESERFPGLVENEACCLELAREAGLPVCDAIARDFGRHRCLILSRYDRCRRGEAVLRLHQEDFCQALGIPSRIKYQTEGGPSLKQSFDLIRSVSGSPARDLLLLFNAVLFNYLIGNGDAHGKNFSLLYSLPGESYSVRLALLYDLVSTACYPEIAQSMAMRIGKKWLPEELRVEDWEHYWKEIGFSTTQAKRRSLQFADSVEALILSPRNEVQQSVHTVIRNRIQLLCKALS
jgi:serine/threonine-protein kinase HipA